MQRWLAIAESVNGTLVVRKKASLLVLLALALLIATSCSERYEEVCEDRNITLYNQPLLLTNHTDAESRGRIAFFQEFEYSGVTYGINIGVLPNPAETPPGIFQITERTVSQFQYTFKNETNITGVWDCRTRTLQFNHRGYPTFILKVNQDMEKYVCNSNASFFAIGDGFAKAPCRNFNNRKK